MEVQILDQTPEDVLEVTRLLRDTWLDTYPNEEYGITKEEILDRYDEAKPDFEERMERRRQNVNQDPSSHSWVAKVDGKIVGFCAAGKGEENRIFAIYVLPQFQGQKIGWKMMKNALDWMGEPKEVYINVASYNQKAINFYEKVGFRKTGKKVEDDVAAFPSGAKIPEIEMLKS